MTGGSTSQTFTWIGLFGLAAGGNIGIELGDGLLIADVRYNMDFADTEFELYEGADPVKFLKQSGIAISIGYVYKFSSGY